MKAGRSLVASGANLQDTERKRKRKNADGKKSAFFQPVLL
jgi:hypothetical protein